MNSGLGEISILVGEKSESLWKRNTFKNMQKGQLGFVFSGGWFKVFDLKKAEHLEENGSGASLVLPLCTGKQPFKQAAVPWGASKRQAAVGPD